MRVGTQTGSYAVGKLAKGKYDMSSHIVPLRRNSTHKNHSVREASAWALWHLSRYKHEIGLAVPKLVQLLTIDEEWGQARKNAAGALLHHSRKSSENARKVAQHLSSATLDLEHRFIKRLFNEMAEITGKE